MPNNKEPTFEWEPSWEEEVRMSAENRKSDSSCYDLEGLTQVPDDIYFDAIAFMRSRLKNPKRHELLKIWLYKGEIIELEVCYRGRRHNPFRIVRPAPPVKMPSLYPGIHGQQIA